MIAPVIVFWVLAAAALFTPPTVAVFLFLCTGPFGAMSVAPGATDTFNILPQSVAVLILAAKVLPSAGAPRVLFRSVIDWRGFAFLTAFVVYAIFTAFVMPQLFAGVDVIPMNDARRLPLEPTSANISQSVYLALNLIAALTLFAYLRKDRVVGDAREVVLRALAATGMIYVFSGLLEWSGLAPAVVSSFKTATYTIFDAGLLDESTRRVAGFLPEASAYGPRCVELGALLFFARSASRSETMRKWVLPLTSLALLGMGAMSTSSTAYAAIFGFVLLLLVRVAMRLHSGVGVRGVGLEMGLMAGVALILVSAWVLNPTLLETPVKLLDMMVIHKSESSSFLERSVWNNIGKLDFRATHGLGVGAGSTRTSNWAISLLSNTGVVGFLLMGGFLGITLTRPVSTTSDRAAAMSRGAKYALLIFLLSEFASGTNIDPGLHLAVFAVLAAAGSRWADGLAPAAKGHTRGRAAPPGGERARRAGADPQAA
jgi:hypothetical protein